ncbi:cholinephosphotransferase 1-like [Asterias amurensis]|uniref:cholinephosphotransferase 1-like n=1 Tax=Asterias amurensis TaxID=7602 RepID=UPI003AB85466
MLMGEILTQEQLRHVSEHVYSVEDWNSLLDPYMRVFWTKLQKVTPKALNGNVITVFGLSFNIISLVILMSYAPTATEKAPKWAYALAALAVFWYQAFDALDGMQARRNLLITQWQLSEIFDHTCDSVSAVCVGIQLAICLRIGDQPHLFLTYMLTVMFMFYTAHWQTYVTGIVRFGTLDVTESQLSLCLAYLLTAFFGPEVWTVKVVGFDVREIIIFSSVAMAIIKFANHFIFIWKRGYRSSVAGTSAVFPVVNIGVVFLLAVLTKTCTNYYEFQPCVFMMIFGLLEAKQSCKLMIAYMSKSSVSSPDSIFLGPLSLLINHLLGSPLSSQLILWLVMVYSAMNLLHYFGAVSLQVSDVIGTPCFLPYGDASKQNGDSRHQE